MTPLTDVNYSDLLVEALTRYPDRTAFVAGDRRVSYAAAADGVGRILRVFAERGLTAGDGIAVLSGNTPEVWLVQAAATLLGLHYSGLHPLGSAEDHAYVCEDAGVDLLVVDPEHAEAGAAIVERSSRIKHTLVLGESELAENLLTLLETAPGTTLTRRAAGPEDVPWIAYTGGTTGRPKGVKLPDRALVHTVSTVIASLDLPSVPRYLTVAPLSHAGVLPILPTLLRGGTVIVHRGFDPEHWLRTVQDERVNWSFCVPTMLYKLLDSGHAAKFDVSSLETLMYGASPMSPSRIAEAHDVLGPVLLQAYGQTECVSWATVLRKDEHVPELLDSCGRAVLGQRVVLLDDEDRAVARGEIGEICVRGRGIMSGYHNRPQETEAALRNDWLHTGDLAVQDDRGFFRIVERKKDMIISGGFNVYSREIEDVIAEDPAVAAVAVIGVPHERWGEAVTAVVVPRPGSTVDGPAITEKVRQRKGKHQAPKSVEVVAELPMTAIGKVDKKKLRESYWDGTARQVH
ncbi:AMP-binding protein [Amycolatopsis dendrobii]|uniref:AMP-binding protein n=1 Tax=Amycolatopsis dendrobii TaxID=2760662 RepID=A0A7W3W255_9PSEU|nr:AMP-binding protein [Amycolatopsis dendrobii]MBB1156947.1 AMP-binding protein [Amycolatopsis dendrobii]